MYVCIKIKEKPAEYAKPLGPRFKILMILQRTGCLTAEFSTPTAGGAPKYTIWKILNFGGITVADFFALVGDGD